MSVSDMIRLSKDESAILVSATDKKNIDQLKEKIALMAYIGPEKHLVRD